MYWTFFPQNSNYENTNMAFILITFQTLVDTIIPRTPRLAQEYGLIQYYGALDADMDQYILLALQNLPNPLAGFTINVLDMAAKLVYSEGFEENSLESQIVFYYIPPEKRLQALELIMMASLFPLNYPRIFQENSELIQSLYGFINRAVMFGYYSEWFGYGSTRLLSPNQRHLEFNPFSWEQIDYPGPSLGYHALRN